MTDVDTVRWRRFQEEAAGEGLVANGREQVDLDIPAHCLDLHVPVNSDPVHVHGATLRRDLHTHTTVDDRTSARTQV